MVSLLTDNKHFGLEITDYCCEIATVIAGKIAHHNR